LSKRPGDGRPFPWRASFPRRIYLSLGHEEKEKETHVDRGSNEGRLVMTIKELVVSIENKAGGLSQIIGHLYENDVTVPAFWLGGEKKKGTFRFIASDPDTASSVLTGLGFKVTSGEVIAARVPDHPGGLNTLLRILASEKINVLHTYPCLQTVDPILIIGVKRPADAVRVLKENWIDLFDERLYHM
jgi:hypothetical protein